MMSSSAAFRLPLNKRLNVIGPTSIMKGCASTLSPFVGPFSKRFWGIWIRVRKLLISAVKSDKIFFFFSPQGKSCKVKTLSQKTLRNEVRLNELRCDRLKAYAMIIQSKVLLWEESFFFNRAQRYMNKIAWYIVILQEHSCIFWSRSQSYKEKKRRTSTKDKMVPFFPRISCPVTGKIPTFFLERTFSHITFLKIM